MARWPKSLPQFTQLKAHEAIRDTWYHLTVSIHARSCRTVTASDFPSLRMGVAVL
jgi:hypothetical protein